MEQIKLDNFDSEEWLGAYIFVKSLIKEVGEVETIRAIMQSSKKYRLLFLLAYKDIIGMYKEI